MSKSGGKKKSKWGWNEGLRGIKKWRVRSADTRTRTTSQSHTGGPPKHKVGTSSGVEQKAIYVGQLANKPETHIHKEHANYAPPTHRHCSTLPVSPKPGQHTHSHTHKIHTHWDKRSDLPNMERSAAWLIEVETRKSCWMAALMLFIQSDATGRMRGWFREGQEVTGGWLPTRQIPPARRQQ